MDAKNFYFICLDNMFIVKHMEVQVGQGKQFWQKKENEVGYNDLSNNNKNNVALGK